MNYKVVVWDNAGERPETPCQAFDLAKALAKSKRNLSNRTVKIGSAGNTLYHWSRATHLPRNHWSQRATSDEWFV